MTLALALIGLVVGLVLGCLGGGGTILALPLLVYVAGLDVSTATTTSLVVVLGAAAVGALLRARRGQICWQVALEFGAVGGIAAAITSQLHNRISERLLLGAFSLVLAGAAFSMLRPAEDLPVRTSVSFVGTPRAIGTAFGVGALTGLFGVGGGFLCVPALAAIGIPVVEATGTSLAIIAINAAVALTGSVGSEAIDIGALVPFGAASVLGVAVGTVAAGSVNDRGLSRAFAVALGVVAVASGFDAAVI